MTHDYTVIYQPIEDGWIMASVPELPGAIAQAPTMEEARGLIQGKWNWRGKPIATMPGVKRRAGRSPITPTRADLNRRAVPGVRRRRRLHSHGPANRS